MCCRKIFFFLNLPVFFFSAGVGPGGISPAQAKAAKYGSLPHSYMKTNMMTSCVT